MDVATLTFLGVVLSQQTSCLSYPYESFCLPPFSAVLSEPRVQELYCNWTSWAWAPHDRLVSASLMGFGNVLCLLQRKDFC